MEERFQVGAWCADTQTNTLQRGTERRRLEPQAMQLLAYLAAHPGEVLSKEVLLDAVWAGRYVTEDVLTGAISALRKAIGDTPREPRYIQTLPRRGYRLIASVRPEDSTVRPEGVVGPTDIGVTLETELPKHPRQYGRLAVLLVILATTTLAIVIVLTSPWKRQPALPAATLSPLVAVLPFESFSSDPDRGFLADGVTDALITALAQDSRLRVISRTSVWAYRSHEHSLAEIAAALSVDAVVEGSVLEDGERIRVTVQLIDAATDQHLWAETYDSELADLLTVVEQLARQVGPRVAGVLTASPAPTAAPRLTANLAPEAVTAYMQGCYLLRTQRPENVVPAREQFERAVEVAPRFARAWVGIAEASWLEAEIGRPIDESYPAAVAAAEQALSLDASLAGAHRVLAIASFGHDWDFAAAEDAFRRVLSLDPNDAAARRWFAALLTISGRFDAAMAQLREAQVLDPVAFPDALLPRLQFLSGQRDEAIAALQSSIALHPEPGLLHITLIEMLEAEGRDEEAFHHWRNVLAATDTPVAHLAAVEETFTAAGWVGVRRLQLARYRDRVAAGTYVSPVDLAELETGLGETDAAFDHLEEAFTQRDMRLLYLNVRPRLVPLHGDPRFADLARRIGLPPPPAPGQ